MKLAAAPGGVTSHPSHPLDPPLLRVCLSLCCAHEWALQNIDVKKRSNNNFKNVKKRKKRNKN